MQCRSASSGQVPSGLRDIEPVEKVEIVNGHNLPIFALQGDGVTQIKVGEILANYDLVVRIPSCSFVVAQHGADSPGLAMGSGTIPVRAKNGAVAEHNEFRRMTHHR